MVEPSKIKLLVVDLDGCLTDGKYYVSSDGTLMKSFQTKDFHALQRLQRSDIEVLILTHCYDTVILKKLEGMPFEAKRLMSCEQLSWDTTKEDYLAKYLADRVWAWDEVAYFGDGDNDLVSMQSAALTGCPCDALPIIKEESHFISDLPGGNGAVADFIYSYFGKNRGR